MTYVQPFNPYPATNKYPLLRDGEVRVLPWVTIKGDQTLRLNYPLNSKSIVYDVGGYRGDWAKEIYTLYKCNLKIFEPVDEYVRLLTSLFKDQENVQIYPYGLGGSNRKDTIGVDLEASSVFKPGKDQEKISIQDIASVMGDEAVDLIKMNIEGGEYELLDRLIDTGLIKNVRNVQIQFHDFVPNAKAKRHRLQKLLSRTHSLTYNYPFIWENWQQNA